MNNSAPRMVSVPAADLFDIAGHLELPTGPWDEMALRLRDLVNAEAHPDDLMVDALAAAMKAKLARAREKGRGGWDNPAECSVTFLHDLLREHAVKPNLDMVDVANLAGMIRHRLMHIPGDWEVLVAHLAQIIPNPTAPADAGLREGGSMLAEYARAVRIAADPEEPAANRRMAEAAVDALGRRLTRLLNQHGPGAEATHTESGKVYRIVGPAQHKDLGSRNWRPTVWYINDQGERFSREVEDFNRSFDRPCAVDPAQALSGRDGSEGL